MDFNRYFKNEEVEAQLMEWAEAYPALARVEKIGESNEGRPIWLLTLTNQESGPDTEKPAIWLDGNIHATEVAGTTTTLYIAHRLLSEYGKNEEVTGILDSSALYIIPRINPDGAKLALADNPRFLRSGSRPYPWEDRQEGLHEQDIDGDGRIKQMRILDPSGDWKISSLDSRLMEKRPPDENQGPYYRLLPEGLIENYDGYVIKHAPPLEGLDFNRNFPFEWRPEGDQMGAGPYPVSEPEIRAVVDFIANHPNINVAVTYHTFSGVILRPYSTKPDDDMEVDDLWVFKKMGEIGKERTGYRCVSTFHDFTYHPKKVTTGAFDDWLFDHLGVFSFTIELWDLPTMAGIEDRKFIEWFREHPHEEDVRILKWIDENDEGRAYSEWEPFLHPQLGEIEIGGWDNLFSWRNPPAKFMGEEAARNFPFVVSLGKMLPKLAAHTLEVTALGNATYRILLVLENQGFLPTYTSQQGKNRKATRPIRVELELPEGVEIKLGKQKTELEHLEGRSNKLEKINTFTSSPTDNRYKVEWVVRGLAESAIKMHITSSRAGVIHREIRLGKGR
jgi:murein tripeptide amidase MpaA